MSEIQTLNIAVMISSGLGLITFIMVLILSNKVDRWEHEAAPQGFLHCPLA